MICAYVRKLLRFALCARRPLCWKTSVRPRAFCRRLDLQKVYLGSYVKGSLGRVLSSWMSRTSSRGHLRLFVSKCDGVRIQDKLSLERPSVFIELTRKPFVAILTGKSEPLLSDRDNKHRYHIPLLTSIPLPNSFLQNPSSGIEDNTGAVFFLEDHGCSPVVAPSRFVKRALNAGRSAPFPIKCDGDFT
jgi:hypothetical protein